MSRPGLTLKNLGIVVASIVVVAGLGLVAERVNRPAPRLSACVVSGCSHELCGSTAQASDCVFQPQYVCYRSATCARQTNGACGWNRTVALLACLQKHQTPTKTE